MCICKAVSSDYFPSNIGVRQGEKLSPFLITIFLNDLKILLSASHIHKGIELEDNILVFLKVFVLLFADDTVISIIHRFAKCT